MKHLYLFLLFLPISIFAQNADIFKIDSLPQQGILLDKGWKWHVGDNLDWAKTNLDDSKWPSINPTLDIHALPQVRQAQIGWFRLKLQVDSNGVNQPLALILSQSGASEIYLNGQLIQRFGQVSNNYAGEHTLHWLNHPFSLRLDRRHVQLLAVRYSFNANNFYLNYFIGNPCLQLQLQATDKAYAETGETDWFHTIQLIMLISIYMFLGAFCLFLHFQFKHVKFYLLLGMWCFGEFFQTVFQLIALRGYSTPIVSLLMLAAHLVSLLMVFALLMGFYSLFQQPKRYFFYFLLVYALLTTPILLVFYEWGAILVFCFYLILNLDTLRLSFQAARHRRPGAWILFVTMLLFYLFFTGFIILTALGQVQLGYKISGLSLFVLPVGFSFFLSGEFARTNQTLINKFIEVEALSVEKQQILATQNETLEKKVIERTTELAQKNRNLEIEGALERVRAKSMSMQSSNELADLVVAVFGELINLDFSLTRCAIAIMQVDASSWQEWTAEIDQSAQSYAVKNAGFPYHEQLVQNWKERNPKWIYHLKGNEMQQLTKYLITKSGYSRIPEPVKEIMLHTPVIILSHSFNNFGYLRADSLEPISEASVDILYRFAKVFDMCYTRFNDLQKAEAQAEQANLDLIQIQTEKKRAEEALKELKITQNQLIQKEKLASLGELTAGIAHEIQNPLNFVNNFSELSVDLIKEIQDERSKTPDKRDEELENELLTDLSQNQEKINLHGKRASNIVKGMLEHSRTSTGERELTDINQLADEYLRLSYHGLRAKDKNFNADFKTDFDENLPKIKVIPQDIGRVLLNLFNNAFYAVRQVANPLVSVSTQQINNQIIIKIKDNGTGMSEVTKAKIFQPFFTTKPTGEGTGLGLSLSYDIITKGHGGTLTVNSIENQGSEFIIILPII